MTQRQLTVQEAADALGMTSDAVRMRVRRGTLDSEKSDDGRVYVLLDTDASRDATRDASRSESGARTMQTVSGEIVAAKDDMIDELRDRIEHLSRIVDTRDEEVRRRDVIISQLTARIPELEASRERRETAAQEAQEVPEGSNATEAREAPETAVQREHDVGEPRVSWWRRIFGG